MFTACGADGGSWCSAASAALRGSAARVAADAERRQRASHPGSRLSIPAALEPGSAAEQAVDAALEDLESGGSEAGPSSSCGGCLLWPLTELQSRLQLQRAKGHLQRVRTPAAF